MLDYEELFAIKPFSLASDAKEELYSRWVPELCSHHEHACLRYAKLVSVLGTGFPLPVRLFKEYDLLSISEDEIVKTMTSSGTTGQAVSRIYLDRATSARQTKALAKIVSSFTGTGRMPLLVIDSKAVLKDRNMFSARGAGILGFSMLGRDITYALDENMELDFDALEAFAARHAQEEVMLFGFTSMVWEYFCKALSEKGRSFDFEGYLIHGGGWKKLLDQEVDNDEFKRCVQETCGIKRVHNYYGMVEQTGSIAMECECGHLHTSIFSDISIVDPFTRRSIQNGRGLIVTTSLLPTSYPGHILLTEDEGEILGQDDCSCGRKGKFFSVYGRMQGAEIRGCSDTHERK